MTTTSMRSKRRSIECARKGNSISVFAPGHVDADHPSLAARQAAAGDPTAPGVSTALQQQLGLKLEPAKGAGEFLVIGHVERPTEN